MTDDLNRRDFGLRLVRAAGAGMALGSAPAVFAKDDRPALSGGKPVRTQPFPGWPRIAKNDEENWTEVLHSKRWCRLDGTQASTFEKTWGEMLGAKHCLAASSGTTALLTALNALDVGPGDEVIVPPYTFVATINVVMMQFALPVFVDTDRRTFQIDADKIEAAITPRTRAILPVHLGGNVANMDKIMAIAQAKNIPVLEDACQAHLAEWRGKKVSTIGAAGCFSFQASKNLNSGEGGALLTNDDGVYERAESFHNNGRGQDKYGYAFVRNGCNHRMTEFQAALLNAQVTRLEAQARTREQNAHYLTSRLKEIPGIAPEEMYEGCTRNAYHLYMFRYDAERFSGLPLDKFLKALRAEGIPAGSGYGPLNKEPIVEATISSRHFRRLFSEAELANYRERIQCPENDRLCQEAVWLTQTMMLGTKADMDDIASAVLKVQKSSAELAKA